jgi:septation ring formation regulator EzrA
LLNFNSIIELVRNIKDKSEEIEGQKTQRISSKWAAQFLTAYYAVISRIGVLSHIISSMSDEIAVPERLKKNLKTQQYLLNRISRQMVTLNAPDVPDEIIARVSDVSKHVQNLINIYKQQQLQQQALDETEEVAQLNEFHENAHLDAAILEVYKQTLNKAFSS